MHITIITAGSRGDVQPYVALGCGLQAAGHAVRLATHAEFEALVRSHGLDFYPVAGNPREMLTQVAGQDWLAAGRNPLPFALGLMRLAQPFAARFVQDCWQACQGADAVAFSVLGVFGGYHVAEKLQVPFYQAYVQPLAPTRAWPNFLFPSRPRLGATFNRLTHALVGELFWQMYRPLMNRVRREVLQLPALPHFGPFRTLERHHYPALFGYSPSVLPQPPDWGSEVHVTGYWFLDRPPDWQPPPDLAAFLDAGPPPVYAGFGSMHDRRAEPVTALVLAALRRTGQRGLLLTGWGELGESALPTRQDIFRVDAVPHDWLFPRVAAVVHHGGAGTTGAGLRAGVPAITVPFFADQPFWGERVHALGAGPAPIPRRALTVARLADAIDRAVHDTAMRARAAELGARIRAEDGVARAVEVIDRHLARAA